MQTTSEVVESLLERRVAELERALGVSLKLLKGLLTDSQLDFKSHEGITARQLLSYLERALKGED